MSTIQEQRAVLANLARQEREIQKQMLQCLLKIKVALEQEQPVRVSSQRLQTLSLLLEECSLVLHSPVATRVSIALALVSAMSQLESFHLDD